jgi:hypothetical protein
LKKDNVFKVEKIRWADSTNSITKIAIIQNKTSELRIYYDSNINKEEHKIMNINKKLCKGKKSRDFIFINTQDRNYFLFLIRQSYFKLAKKHLIIESIKIS